MKRTVVEPTEKAGMHSSHDPHSKTFTHPAYGQISVSRTTGGAVLHGSDFEHNAFMRIEIKRSELNRDLARDWHFPRETICEVWLSEAQWATFVSSPNMGSGPPCTIAFVAHEGEMPELPLRSQNDIYRAEVNAKAKDAGRRVEAAITEINETLGTSISEKKKKALIDILGRLRQDLASNLPFVVKSYEEHMETTVERAKIEVDAYLHSAIMRAGLAAIAGEAPIQLAGPSEPGRALASGAQGEPPRPDPCPYCHDTSIIVGDGLHRDSERPCSCGAKPAPEPEGADTAPDFADWEGR